MNLSVLIVGDYLELVRILENKNLHEYELTDMPMEQPDESAHKLMYVGMAPTSGTPSTSGLAPCNWSSTVACSINTTR